MIAAEKGQHSSTSEISRESQTQVEVEEMLSMEEEEEMEQEIEMYQVDEDTPQMIDGQPVFLTQTQEFLPDISGIPEVIGEEDKDMERVVDPRVTTLDLRYEDDEQSNLQMMIHTYFNSPNEVKEDSLLD